jgi:hypothetical protein
VDVRFREEEEHGKKLRKKSFRKMEMAGEARLFDNPHKRENVERRRI